MSILQQFVGDLLQTWPNFQRTANDVLPWYLWLIFVPLVLLTFGAPFMDTFFCLRKLHRLQPRFLGDTDMPRYKAARTKLILTTCLLYGLGIFLTYPNIVKDPTSPNPGYLYAIGVIVLFIATVGYRRSGLFISTVLTSLMTYTAMCPILSRLLDGPEFNAVGMLIFIVTLGSFIFPTDVWAYNIFNVYCIDNVTRPSDSVNDQTVENPSIE